MNIAGVIVHANPAQQAVVRATLQSLQGVEIHAETSEGRFIITVEEDDNKVVADTLLNLHKLQGVLSAAMVYQHSEADLTAEEVV